MIRAAWRVNGVIRSGDSHVQILDALTIQEKQGSLEHGYLDPGGDFVSGLEDLVQFMRDLYLVRHAQSRYNVHETTDLDSELTALGQEQAAHLADHLHTLDLRDYIGYVSPFLRTLLTARPIARETGIVFKVLPTLAEYGTPWTVNESYGITVPNRKEQFPEFDWSLYPEDNYFREESSAQFHQRMDAIIRSELPEHVLLVSHGAIVWTLAAMLLGNVSGGYGDVPNASLTCIQAAKAIYLFRKV